MKVLNSTLVALSNKVYHEALGITEVNAGFKIVNHSYFQEKDIIMFSVTQDTLGPANIVFTIDCKRDIITFAINEFYALEMDSGYGRELSSMFKKEAENAILDKMLGIITMSNYKVTKVKRSPFILKAVEVCGNEVLIQEDRCYLYVTKLNDLTIEHPCLTNDERLRFWELWSKYTSLVNQ